MNATDDRPAAGAGNGGVARRAFLMGVAGVSAGAVAARSPSPAYAATEEASGLHGVQLRGMFLTSKDPLAEGRFGAMFKRLPAFAPPDDLLSSLAGTMVEDQTVPDDTHLNTSPRLFAGHTFIGQRVPLDHKPSDYFRERVWISCDPDERTIPALAERFGVERFMWASDFPHADHTPQYVDDLDELARAFSESDRTKFLGDNARHLFDLPAGRP